MANGLELAARSGKWQPGQPLRLHLGCGETLFPGYVNIDHPSSEHNVMAVRPDVTIDIRQLDFAPESVDEVRCHHLFEHFNRVTALAMLIRWHAWLKPGGRLYIETPDFEGCARTFTASGDWAEKMGQIRHLTGDQAASWAYHIDQWFPERFVRTLRALGFDPVETQSVRRPHSPHLSDVHAIGIKRASVSREAQLEAADRLLAESLVHPAHEAPTLAVWKGQLRNALAGNETGGTTALHPAPSAPPAPALTEILQPRSTLPIQEIYEWNQRERDRWVRQQTSDIPPGSVILDVGSGTCPYRSLFAHCDYRTHDFKKYEGVKLGNTNDYGKIDYVSDVTNIPAPDGTFDVILCTEVLEHVPEPIEALREMARLAKVGGRLILTAPLGSGLHQLPYHFYGGYTPFWYLHFARKFRLCVTETTPNGGFYKHLAQECCRVAGNWNRHQTFHGAHRVEIQQLFAELLPRYLMEMEERIPFPDFTVGYHVQMIKPGTLAHALAFLRGNPRHAELHYVASLLAEDEGKLDEARRLIRELLEIDPNHADGRERATALVPR